MQVTVRLLASCRRYLPKDHDVQAGYPHDVQPGYQVGDLLADLPIPVKDVHTFLGHGTHKQQDQVLHGGGILAVLPAVTLMLSGLAASRPRIDPVAGTIGPVSARLATVQQLGGLDKAEQIVKQHSFPKKPKKRAIRRCPLPCSQQEPTNR